MSTPINFRAMDEAERRYDGPIPSDDGSLTRRLHQGVGRRMFFNRMIREEIADLRRYLSEGRENSVIRCRNNLRTYLQTRRHWHRQAIEAAREIAARAEAIHVRMAAE